MYNKLIIYKLIAPAEIIWKSNGSIEDELLPVKPV